MRNVFRRLMPTLAVAAVALASLSAQAGPYSRITIFGDSLSDTGNLFIATGGAQPPAGQPYFNGRFSDGPVWVEHLAAGIGLELQAAPSLAGGNNFAFAGARTGTGATPPGLLAQVGGLWAPANPGGADPNGLYVVVAGGNDLRDARGAGSTEASRQAAAEAAVGNVAMAVSFLAGSGARNVLIANLPDLGATPEAALLGLVGNSSDISMRFNSLMSGLEAQLETLFVDLDVSLLDIAGLGAAVRNDALTNGGAVYGITNATTPCDGFLFSTGAACSVSLFSDALHPSARAHALIGAAALDLLGVPEPGSVLLVGAALALMLSARRGRAAQTPA